MNIRFLLLPFLLVAAAATLRAQSAPVAVDGAISSPVLYREQPFDVLRYDATIDLTKALSKEMRGQCTILFRWTGEPASAPFRFHLRSLSVDSVRYNGQAATAVAVEDPSSPTFHYAVTPPAGVRHGDTSSLVVHYHGTMTGETWGGVQSQSGTLYSMGVGFSNNYVSATQHWLPCYDHPSDKAAFHGRFLVPNRYSVASNGVLESVTSAGDSTTVYDWRHDVPCATYLYTFAVDRYLPVQFGDGTPPIVVYGRPEDTARIRTTLRLLPRMVDMFERRFTPYPFEKVGYAATPTGAMEHQTMISLNRSLAISNDTVSSVAAHELAHQWFGDLVSPLDFRHAWLTESFATFSEALWAEELGGQPLYLADLQTNVNSYITQVSRSEGIFPLYDFPRTSPSSNYPATIYAKGAAVVGMLRYELGDSIFFRGLKEYLTRHAYGTATTDSMRLVMEQVAGRSLGWFFDQWVLGKGWPILNLQTTLLNDGSGNVGASVHIVQTQPDSIGTFVGLPVEIGFVPVSGAPTYRMIRLDSRDTTVFFQSLPAFRSVTINQGPTVRALLRVGSGTVTSAPELAGTTDSSDIRFTVRPNPASNNSPLTVQMTGGSDCRGIEYQMFESTGRRLLVGTSDSCEFTIPTQGFASGAYLLRFRHAGIAYDIPVAIAR